MPNAAEVAYVLAAFGLRADAERVHLYGNGHIHDTFVAPVDHSGRRVLVQRLHPHVFPNVDTLTENIVRVTAHLRGKLERRGVADAYRRVLTPFATKDGAYLYRDARGDAWRVFAFIERAVAFDVLASAAQAEQAARAFGAFQRDLSDLPGPPLAPTIPYFHDAARRYQTFEASVERDASERAGEVRAEIAFACSRAAYADLLAQASPADLPRRATHNDAKLNNLLFDAQTGEALCVVDLDTTMPGTVLYDFGDLVRSGAGTAPEDTRDPDSMALDTTLFCALARGYWHATRDTLTPFEKHHLVFSGLYMTFVMGLRFLTDYLDGDPYYKTAYPEHNLDRCRAQFALIQSIEVQRGALETFVAHL